MSQWTHFATGPCRDAEALSEWIYEPSLDHLPVPGAAVSVVKSLQWAARLQVWNWWSFKRRKSTMGSICRFSAKWRWERWDLTKQSGCFTCKNLTLIKKNHDHPVSRWWWERFWSSKIKSGQLKWMRRIPWESHVGIAWQVGGAPRLLGQLLCGLPGIRNGAGLDGKQPLGV